MAVEGDQTSAQENGAIDQCISYRLDGHTEPKQQIPHTTGMRNPKKETALFDGEVLDTFAGFTCTYKYVAPDSSAMVNEASQHPLVVLIPGGASHARIYYGGHEGFNKEDFLVTWLARAGFPVLAISYPLDSETACVKGAAGFRLTDWGRQAAQVTKRVADTQSLAGRPVLLATWSMGGRMVVPYTEAAERECGLKVGLVISLAATQGFASMRPIPPGIRCTRNGYADCDGLLDMFLGQISQQEARHQTTLANPTQTAGGIIPPGIYSSCYYGYTPVSLHGWRLRHDQCPTTGQHRFLPDNYGAEEDAAPPNHDFSSMPWLASITCTDAIDARHVLLDELVWKSWTAQRMTAIWEQLARTEQTRAQYRWQEFSGFVHHISRPGVLHRKVEGNHFFFVGRDGARSTASAISDLWNEKSQLHRQFDQIVGETPGREQRL